MLKGYRTVIFNSIMAIIAIVKAIFPDAETPDGETVSGLLTNADALIVGVMALGNLFLRAITTTPVFKKEPTE